MSPQDGRAAAIVSPRDGRALGAVAGRGCGRVVPRGDCPNLPDDDCSGLTQVIAPYCFGRLLFGFAPVVVILVIQIPWPLRNVKNAKNTKTGRNMTLHFRRFASLYRIALGQEASRPSD